MKHPSSFWTPEAQVSLIKGCDTLGIRLTTEQIEALEGFANLLIEANSHFNLTSITDPVEVAIKHFVDSLAAVLAYDFTRPVAAVDLGTGAGFPGIPLKIVFPSLRMVFVEATRKKIEFVRSSASQLGLTDCDFRWCRAEEAASGDLREQQDVVLARALGHLSTVCELGLPLLRDNGKLVAFKGPEFEKEMVAARSACALLGSTIEQTANFELPISGDRRTIVVVVKHRSINHMYPRSANLPKRFPLGVGE